jgi:tetratricopeptide (TPR) repeat protein
MNTRSLLIGSALALLVQTAAAQAPSQQRLDAIWSAVDGRVSQQIDDWFDTGDFPKAIHLLRFQNVYYPHDYDVATNLGWMQENVEEWDAALETYRLYSQNNPNDRDRALPEGDYLYRRKQYAKIPELFEPYIKLKPHPNVYRILAHTYEKLNRYTDAKRIWLAYVAAYPNDLAGQSNLRKVEKKLASGTKS